MNGLPVFAKRAAWVLGTTSVLALVGAGCSLFVVPPPSYRVVGCRATVVSEEGAIVTLATGSSPGFGRQRYFVCEDDTGCLEGAAASVPVGSRVPEFELDWSRYVHRQIGRIADGSLDYPESEFAVLDGPWCIQEPSIRCEVTAAEVPDRGEASDPDFVLEPLGDPGIELFCPPYVPPIDPPEPEPCLQVTCGDAPCGAVDFGAIPVGMQSEPRTIKIDNCGTGNAPVVEVKADGNVFADATQADFFASDNTCLPDSALEQQLGVELLAPAGAEESGNSGCSLVVRFAPDTAFDHVGHLEIDGLGTTRVDLTGKGLGGALAVTDAATGEAVDSVCMIRAFTACVSRELLIGNAGPGRLIVQDVTIEEGGTEFSVSGALLGQLPWRLAADAPPVAIEVQACQGPDTSAELRIASDQPGAPTATIPVELSDSCP